MNIVIISINKLKQQYPILLQFNLNVQSQEIEQNQVAISAKQSRRLRPIRVQQLIDIQFCGISRRREIFLCICATCLNCCGRSLIWMRFILPCLCVCTNSPFYHQNNNSFGLLENFGRYVKILQPGFNVINPLTQKVIQISRQTKLLTVNQSVISKDNISFDISTIIYYRVFDPIKLAYKLGKTEISESVSELTFATVRTICGEGVFQDLLQKRELIGDRLKDHINQQINTWGIYIEQLFIKDLILSYELQRDLSQVASIKKIQQATIINAQALVETAKCFSQVAQSLSTKAAYQMRYLNILNEVSQQNNQKIIMLPLNEKQ